MMMEASFDAEESFDDPSCLAPQPPGSLSPAKRPSREVKETKITVSEPLASCQLHHRHRQQHLLTSGRSDVRSDVRSPGAISRFAGTCVAARH